MSLDVTWTGPALRDLGQLDKLVARQVDRAVARFAQTSAGDVSRLRPPEVGYRLRVRDTAKAELWHRRVLFDVDRTEGVMTVLRVLHRSQAYKER